MSYAFPLILGFLLGWFLWDFSAIIVKPMRSWTLKQQVFFLAWSIGAGLFIAMIIINFV